MRRDLRRKTWFILILVVVVGVYAILPIFSPTLKQLFFRGNDPIRRGLDLKGGIEIILAPITVWRNGCCPRLRLMSRKASPAWGLMPLRSAF